MDYYNYDYDCHKCLCKKIKQLELNAQKVDIIETLNNEIEELNTDIDILKTKIPTLTVQMRDDMISVKVDGDYQPDDQIYLLKLSRSSAYTNPNTKAYSPKRQRYNHPPNFKFPNHINWGNKAKLQSEWKISDVINSKTNICVLFSKQEYDLHKTPSNGKYERMTRYKFVVVRDGVMGIPSNIIKIGTRPLGTNLIPTTVALFE